MLDEQDEDWVDGVFSEGESLRTNQKCGLKGDWLDHVRGKNNPSAPG
ncbi:MAG: hypothetical protein R3C61_15045 [Bacteroidia bacterium]